MKTIEELRKHIANYRRELRILQESTDRHYKSEKSLEEKYELLGRTFLVNMMFIKGVYKYFLKEELFWLIKDAGILKTCKPYYSAKIKLEFLKENGKNEAYRNIKLKNSLEACKEVNVSLQRDTKEIIDNLEKVVDELERAS